MEVFWFGVVRDFFLLLLLRGWIFLFWFGFSLLSFLWVLLVGLGFFENKSILKSISVKRKIPIPTLIFARKYLSFSGFWTQPITFC